MKGLAFTRMDVLDYATNEALNTLATNLSFSGSDMRKIMLTSCQPQEGKSFLTFNLMRKLAEMGKRVVLVDADLRKSVLVGRYGIVSNSRILGMTHYLSGQCALDDVLYETEIENGFLVPVGRDVVNSLSLLNTSKLPNMLNALAKSFDIVLIDAPPVGIIIDAAEIAKSCDGVLFVVSANKVARRELIEAQQQIVKTGCPIIGAVLNKISFDTHSAKKYYHKTYYTHYNAAYFEKKEKRKKPTSK